jgi:hypothetical protein
MLIIRPISDFKKIDFLIEQNKKILRGREQIKAQNLDIKTLSPFLWTILFQQIQK